MSVMQIVTQLAAGIGAPRRRRGLGVARALARRLGRRFGLRAIVFAGIDVTRFAPPRRRRALQGRLSDAFHTAFIIAAGLCVLAALAASRLPDLRFDDEMQGETPPADSPMNRKQENTSMNKRQLWGSALAGIVLVARDRRQATSSTCAPSRRSRRGPPSRRR